MESFRSVLIEDLEVYKRSLDEKNYPFCNIIGNRLTINACVLESKEFVLIGAILKNIIPYFQRLEEKIEKNANKALKKIIDDIIEMQENLDSLIILDKYSEFFDTYRQNFNTSLEIYKENKDYTSKVFDFCIKFLIKESEENKIPLSQNLLFSGVLNELSRASNNYGCTSHQLMLQLIISFFSRLDDYFRVLIISNDTVDTIWNERYNNYKKMLIENLNSYEMSDTYIKKSVDDLFIIVKEWRFMFFRLMNIGFLTKEEKIKIPSKVEEELKQMVSKVTSQEIEGKEK